MPLAFGVRFGLESGTGVDVSNGDFRRGQLPGEGKFPTSDYAGFGQFVCTRSQYAPNCGESVERI